MASKRPFPQKFAGGYNPPTAGRLAKRRLRIADPDGGNAYTFWINPENYCVREASLTSINHTADGGVVNHWGRDFPHLSLSGTTGLGYLTEYLNLRDKVMANLNAPANKKPPWMRLYNFLNGEAWYIVILSFELRQNKDRPTLYAYALEARIVGEVKGKIEGAPPTVLTGSKDVESANEKLGEALAA